MSLRIVLSSIVSDAHTWNLVYMQLLIEELGHEVINLGNCVPLGLLLESMVSYRPDLLVISTINGHGHIEAVEAAQAIKKTPHLSSTRMVIGGKLGTRGEDNKRYSQKLIEAGFEAVFMDDQPIGDFTKYLENLSKDFSLLWNRTA